MEQVHRTMSELDDLMNDNSCSNDGIVEHDKVDCHIGVVESPEAIDIDENEHVEKLIEDNGNDSRNEYDISSKETNDSVMSDNDMFEDSFDKNHIEPDDVESALKSFECATEGKNLSTNFNEIESISEEKSNQSCIFDLIQRIEKDPLSIDDGKISSSSVGEENTDSSSTNDSSQIQISSSAEAMDFPITDKPDCNNQDINEELLTSHDISHDVESNNVNNVAETFENGDSTSNGMDMISSNKLTEISNGYSDTENINNEENIDKNGMEGIDEMNDSRKDNFVSKSILTETEDCLEEAEEEELPINNTHLPEKPQPIQDMTNTDQTIELQDEYEELFKGISQEENRIDKTIDSGESENKADSNVVNKNEIGESENLEKEDKRKTYKDLSDMLKSDCDQENKITDDSCVSLSENILGSEGNSAASLTDFHYSNGMAPKSNEISSSEDTSIVLDSTFDSPHSSNIVDKVVMQSKNTRLRISSRSLLNSSVKSSLGPPVKNLKNIDSIKLKTCHVNLKKVHVNDNFSPQQSKPNLGKLKRKLEEMLYESTKQEESGIKEIKKMRQERSKAYGNLLKELTRVKNKIKNMK